MDPAQSADEELLALLCEQDLITRGQESRLRANMRRGMGLAQAIAKTPLVDPVKYASLQAKLSQRAVEEPLVPQEPAKPSADDQRIAPLRDFTPIRADDDQPVALEITDEPPATVKLGDKEFTLKNLGPVGTVPEPPDEELEEMANAHGFADASTVKEIPTALELELDSELELSFADAPTLPAAPPPAPLPPPVAPPPPAPAAHDVPQEPGKPGSARKKGSRLQTSDKETDSRISRMATAKPIIASTSTDDDTLPLPGMGPAAPSRLGPSAVSGMTPLPPPPPPSAAETAASRETPAEPVAIPDDVRGSHEHISTLTSVPIAGLDPDLELDPDFELDFGDAPAQPAKAALPDDLELGDFDFDLGGAPAAHHSEPASEELHDQVGAVLDDLFEEGTSSPQNPLPPAETLAGPAARQGDAADYEPRAARVQQYDLGDDEGIPLIGEVNGILRKALEAKALALEFDITLQGTTQRTYDRAGSRTDEKPLDMERSQKIVNRIKVMARLEPWRRNQSQKGKCIVRTGRQTFQMLVDQEPGRDGREMLTIYFQPQ